jgi:hypothetical protein
MDPEASRLILGIAVGALLAFIAGEIRASRDASRRAKEQRDAFADAERARYLAEKREEARAARGRIRHARIDAIRATRDYCMGLMYGMFAAASGDEQLQARHQLDPSEHTERDLALIGDPDAVEALQTFVQEMAAHPGPVTIHDGERLDRVRGLVNGALDGQRDRALLDQPLRRLTEEDEKRLFDGAAQTRRFEQSQRSQV